MLLLEVFAQSATPGAILLAFFAPVAPFRSVLHAEEAAPVWTRAAKALLLAVLALLVVGATVAVLTLVLETVVLAD